MCSLPVPPSIIRAELEDIELSKSIGVRTWLLPPVKAPELELFFFLFFFIMMLAPCPEEEFST